MSLESTAPAKNFSSIARRLLLTGEIQPNLLKKICDCDFCVRFRGITDERLTAPLEKPYKLENSKAFCRPHFGSGGRTVVRNVRNFFEEFKNLVACSCHGVRGTILNSPITMTSLACGVSLKTVSKYAAHREEKAKEQVRTQQMVNLNNYKIEWGVVVRHFVNNELKQGLDIAVSDLYSKICYAYADFPMVELEFFKFLKSLGFPHRVDGRKRYIVSKFRECKSREYKCDIHGPSRELHEPKSEGVDKL